MIVRFIEIASTLRQKETMKMKAKGKEGLTAQTRRPRHSPKRKINEELIKLVMELRKVRNIGIRLLNVNFF
ncbi:hypothetical protein CXU14_11750 [Akkermansia muciniphila]|nr:hypothetical protein CXU16_03835 [Akkermansia muciniphila]PNC42284.1 hypothetical protein CXU14_11750 [Akkermansia muciniphila]